MNSTAIALTAAAVLLTAAVVYVVASKQSALVAGGMAATPEQQALTAAVDQARNPLGLFTAKPGTASASSGSSGITKIANNVQAGIVKGKAIYGSVENLFNSVKSLF